MSSKRCIIFYFGADTGPVGRFLYQPYNIYDPANHKIDIITIAISKEDFIFPKFIFPKFVLEVFIVYLLIIYYILIKFLFYF